jgi:hypothetical protein
MSGTPLRGLQGCVGLTLKGHGRNLTLKGHRNGVIFLGGGGAVVGSTDQNSVDRPLAGHEHRL